jgi:hypothetical protein
MVQACVERLVFVIERVKIRPEVQVGQFPPRPVLKKRALAGVKSEVRENLWIGDFLFRVQPSADAPQHVVAAGVGQCG